MTSTTKFIVVATLAAAAAAAQVNALAAAPCAGVWSADAQAAIAAASALLS